MKKFFSVVLSLLLVIVLAGCTHNSITGGGNQPPSGGTDTAKEFTVTVELDGEKFTQTSGMKAVWSNRGGVFQAEFGEDSVARTTGPDGDYKVTLENLPDGYAYNPNAHTATNRMNEISVEIFRLNDHGGQDGSNLYGKAISVRTDGAYRVELQGKKANSKDNSMGYANVKYFEFIPQQQGKYIIESWVDTTFNVVNPYVDVYTGTIGARFFNRTVDEGGVSDTYTKNFVFTVEIFPDQFSQNGGGQSTYVFGIHATQKTNTFPVTVDFRIFRYDENLRPGGDKEIVQPTHDFSEGFTMDTGTWTWAEGDSNLMDADDFMLNPEDGFYYCYTIDELGNIVWGSKLYVMISTSIPTVGGGKRPFVDYEGSTISFKAFALGYAPTNPLQHLGGADYSEFVLAYAYAARNDRYPVTEEMKEVLQMFAISQRYFADGEGWYEDPDNGIGVSAAEEDQWLFACGYYK